MAQWVKRWSTDLAVPSSIPTRGEIFSTVNGVPLHTGGWSGGAMVLGKLPVPGRPTYLD